MLRVKTNARAIVNQMAHLCNIQNYPFFAIQLILIYKRGTILKRQLSGTCLKRHRKCRQLMYENILAI